MSRWFRWYEGTTEDAKFRVVARMSRVTLRDVIALWAFILEDAADIAHRGVCNRNEDFMAATLDFDDGVVEDILAAMQNVGLISVGYGAITVCNFSKRQFESDTDPTSTERKRRQRTRDKGVTDADVTRDSRPPDTEEQIQIQKEAASAASSAPAPKMPGLTECERQVIASLRSANVDPSNFPDVGHAALWQAQGYDPAICAAVVAEALRRGKRVRSLAWFDDRIREAHEQRAPAPAPIQEIPERLWEARVAEYRVRPDQWPRGLGKPPDHPECKAPASILAKHGFRSAA